MSHYHEELYNATSTRKGSWLLYTIFVAGLAGVVLTGFLRLPNWVVFIPLVLVAIVEYVVRSDYEDDYRRRSFFIYGLATGVAWLATTLGPVPVLLVNLIATYLVVSLIDFLWKPDSGIAAVAWKPRIHN